MQLPMSPMRWLGVCQGLPPLSPVVSLVGTLTTIRIRGVSTFNASSQEPLVVVDGIQSSMNAVNAMDPYEIESINLLKDASATAVYGVERR